MNTELPKKHLVKLALLVAAMAAAGSARAQVAADPLEGLNAPPHLNDCRTAASGAGGMLDLRCAVLLRVRNTNPV